LPSGRKRGNMKQIGTVISTYRKDKKISQAELTVLLEKYGVHVLPAAVSAWEKGKSSPHADAFLALCEILGIQDVYGEFIGENPSDPFRNLNELGIQKALEYVKLLELSDDYKKTETKILSFTPRVMKIALTSTSAGTGNFLDEENFEEVEISDPVPEKASFGVYLDGDSMEPRFKNGSLVWIEKTDAVEDGEIGLFFLDGMTYFKKLVKKKTGTFLVSLNAKYKPIPISEFSAFKIFGRLSY
jgi:phage repressor protein C with HTH and peptisase S24 domain